MLNDSAKKYNLNSNLDKTKYIQEALGCIAKFATPAEQEIYLSEVQKIVRVPVDALRKSLNKNENKEVEIVEPEVNIEDIKNNAIKESKIFILASMLYKKAEIENISTLFLTQDELKDLYEFLREKIENNKDYNVSSLFDSFEIKANSLIDKVVNYNFPENYKDFLSDTIKKVRINELETEKAHLKQLMSNSASVDEQFEFLKQIQEIDKMINKEKK